MATAMKVKRATLSVIHNLWVGFAKDLRRICVGFVWDPDPSRPDPRPSDRPSDRPPTVRPTETAGHGTQGEPGEKHCHQPSQAQGALDFFPRGLGPDVGGLLVFHGTSHKGWGFLSPLLPLESRRTASAGETHNLGPSPPVGSGPR